MCLYDEPYMDHALYSCPCPFSCSLFIEDVPVWQALHGSCLIFMSMSSQLLFVYRRCACMTSLTWIMPYIHVHVLSVVLCLWKMCLYDKPYMDHVLYSCPCSFSCSLFIEDVPVWQALHGSCLIFMCISSQLLFVYRRCACMTSLTWIMPYIHVHVLSVVLCL